MAMPAFFALLSHKITSPVVSNLFHNKPLGKTIFLFNLECTIHILTSRTDKTNLIAATIPVKHID